jgi:hypothetical protein
MRLLTILLTTILSQTAFGQIVNSISPDQTGMFFYSVDSLIEIVKKERKIDRIILRADLSITQHFPTSLYDIPIIKEDKIQNFQVKGVHAGDVVFRISGPTIIRDQVTLSIGTYEKINKRLTFFAAGAYIFYFKYLPETETYKLTKIKSGVML